MEMPKEVEKEKSSFKSRVKTGLRRVSARVAHPRRSVSMYADSTASDSSDDALHIHHDRSPTTSTSSSDGTLSCADLQVSRTKGPGTPDRKENLRVRQRVVSLGKLLFPVPPPPASPSSCHTTPDCHEKPPHIPRKLKKRSRTASAATYVSSDYMSFSAIDNAPAVPPGDLHQSPQAQELEVQALDPFLVDDPESPEPITPAPAPVSALAPTPATDSRDITPSHEVEISTPPLPVTPEVAPELEVSLNVDKPVPPPPAPVPASESSEEDEPEVPAIYLPQLVLPTMFLPIPNVRLCHHLTWWYSSSPRIYYPHVD